MPNFNRFIDTALHSLEQLQNLSLNTSANTQGTNEASAFCEQHEFSSKVVYVNPATGCLAYPAYNEGGDRILDFSSVGYMEGNEILPNIDHLIKQVVEPSFPQTNDDTERIQNALDWVGNLPIDPSSGFRGIVQLGQGTYRISRPLELHVSGVILQGIENGGTVLENIGNENHLIRISGKPNELAKKRAPIVDDYIPVGSTELNVKHADRRFKRGDTVVVAVNFNAAWIKAIGMDIIHPKGDTTKNNGWKPGRFEHLRRILDVKGDKVVLNSPITTRLEQCYGGGYVEIYTSHRIQKVGIQYLTLLDPRNAQRTKEIIMKNEKNKVKDYRFASEMFDQVLIEMDHAENCWVKQVTSVWWRNFVRLGTNTLAITFSQCRHTFPPGSVGMKEPITPLVGQFGFEISGQQILIDQCHVEHSFHAYSFKGRIPGPNVIYQSNAVGRLGDVGPHMKWSSGQLYDNCNIEGQLIIQDRFDAGSGHGWSGANSVVWNSVAHTGVVVQCPPVGQNFLLGSSSKRGKARMNHPWAWEELKDSKIHPTSLYLTQLYEKRRALK
ncbi:uncharacterized protein BX664DRAFT_385116 [Halteromyces radiatus]|uniref:uncharacterized protein n=1 Tax=Halteromyces radiatus TaxID=101107 RepID=UPI00221FA700|nr:uncharacterized protein BX664DRAFT_385116 [Halteromyces radiatus]KAI8093739.1 hypothetical protein BX664DRAFT_385116 [Halteromyces radiatus]